VKKLIYLIILFFTLSCGTKKTTIQYKEKVIVDTLTVFKDRIISKPVIDTLLIKTPCDTLGQLKDFEKTIKTEVVEVVISNIKGNIQATVNIDSIQQVWEKEYRKTIKDNIKIKEVIIKKKKIPFSLILALILSITLNIALIRK
jgi:hypothetical protein